MNLRKVWTIMKREYLERVRTKAFLVTTLLVPVLMFGLTVAPSMLAMKQGGSAKKLAIVASERAFGEMVVRSMERAAKSLPGASYQTEVVSPGTPDQLKELEKRVTPGDLNAYLVVTDDAIKDRKLAYVGRNSADLIETQVLSGAVYRAYIERIATQHGITGDDLDNLLSTRFEIEGVLAGKGTKTSGRATLFGALLLMMMLYMSIILHGIAVMRSVLEEKTSRIVEVLLAAVTPKELMTGKILGVSAVGLTQLAIWYGTGALVVAFGIAQARMMTNAPVEISMRGVAYFPLFFVLGYFLYSTLWAALGAMVNSEQEAQQMQFFVMMPLFLSTILMVPAIINPNSPLVVAASLFPFCTPLLMYIRLAVSAVPVWQVAAGIAGMLLAIWLVLVVASRIYRVGILMYGKKPTLPELWKWFRYA